MRDVYTAGPICVALELPDQGLVVQIPNRNVPIAAAGETDFGIRTDGQGITGWSRGRQLSLDSGCGRGQVPDGKRAGLTTHNERAPIGEKLARADVVVPVLEGEEQSQVLSTCLVVDYGSYIR